MYISKGIYAWLLISSAIVAYDASYVLLRPHSLKGGQYHQYFQPYELYIQYDTLYAGNDNTFVRIQSWLNYIEITLAVVACVLSFQKGKGSKIRGALLAVIISAFTFWKTVIYVWYAEPFLTSKAKVLTTDSFLCFWLPTSFWLICPLWTILSVSGRIAKDAIASAPKPKKN
jgi:hypothetical protein